MPKGLLRWSAELYMDGSWCPVMITTDNSFKVLKHVEHTHNRSQEAEIFLSEHVGSGVLKQISNRAGQGYSRPPGPEKNWICKMWFYFCLKFQAFFIIKLNNLNNINSHFSEHQFKNWELWCTYLKTPQRSSSVVSEVCASAIMCYLCWSTPSFSILLRAVPEGCWEKQALLLGCGPRASATGDLRGSEIKRVVRRAVCVCRPVQIFIFNLSKWELNNENIGGIEARMNWFVWVF